MNESTIPTLSFESAVPGTNGCADFKHSLAVIIGINDYSNGISQLATAANDARRLATILQTAYGYDVHLVVEEVTKARLTTLFQEQLAAKVGADDRLLVYFAGHGIALDGDDGPEGFLIPSDAHLEDRETFLPMTAVYQGLIDLPCRHMLAVLDCCFAGAFRWSSTRHLQWALPPVLHQERYDRFVRDPAWQVITSAAYDQRALDILAGAAVGSRGVVDTDAGQHSPFALALFEALGGAADLIPRGQGDGVITAAELYLYLRDYVEVKAAEQAGHYQTPGIWPLRRHGKGEYIFLVPGHELNLPPAPELTAQNNPYRGLEAYNEEHADLFFGRTEVIRQLARQVAAQPLTVVLGASGTGKSSLVKAGLVPRLRNLQNPTIPQAQELIQTANNGDAAPSVWQLLTPIRPNDTPLRVLAERLAMELGGAAPVEPAVQAIEQRIDQWLAAHPQTHLLLIVDQFEELVTLCRDDQERLDFLTVLADLIQRQAGQMHIVLTLRTDFEPQFINSPLSPFWQDTRFVITPLTQAELREVIEKPAAARVLFFDPPDLVDYLVDEVIQTPGALPLLSFTLSELYLKYLKRQEQAQREAVTLERSLRGDDYRELGGVIGSLRTRANEIYAALDEAQQETMQRIMLRMVAEEGGELARRRVLWSELEYSTSDKNSRVKTVVDRLVEARLLVQGSVDFDNDNVLDAYVEPAHDALVRAWDKLLVWRQAAEYLPLQRRLTQAAQEWSRGAETDKDGLLWNNDPGLSQVLPDILRQSGALGFLFNMVRSLWPAGEIEQMPTWLNKLETEFITASFQQRISIRRRAVLITLGVFVSLLALTIFAFVQQNRAVRQAAVSQSVALSANARQAIQNDDYDLAIPLALAANQIDDPPSLAVNALAAAAYVPGAQRHLTGHSADVTGVAFSPDGAYALTGSLDRSARLWDTKTGEVVYQLDQAQLAAGVTSVAYNPTGQQALLGLENGSLVVWDLTTGEVLHNLAGPSQGITHAISALAYSPDGQHALRGDNVGGLMLWDVANGKPLLPLAGHKESVTSLAISPDGYTALSGARDNRMVLWDLDTGQMIQQFEGHQGDIILVAYGPFAGNVISGSRDYNVVVWSIETGEPQDGFLLSQHTQAIGSIAVAPDDATVISGAWDGSMILWDKPPIGAYVRSFVGHRAPVISLAYSQDGRYVLSGAKNGDVRLWDIGGPTQLRRFTIEPPLVEREMIDPIYNLSLDEAHHRAFSGAAGALILWDLETGEEIHRFPAPADRLSSVALSSDGATALSAADGDLTLWDLTTYTAVLTLAGHSNEVLNIAYAADGQTALSGSNDGVVIGWDLETGQPAWRHNLPKDDIWSIAFSVDGSLALTGSEDRSVISWDLATGQEIHRFEGHHDAVYWVAISPDGQTALSGSADRQVILWDLATGQPIRTFQGHTLPIHAVAYSPDGATILSGGEDHTVRLWDIATGAEIFRFEGHSATIQNVLYLRQQLRILSRANDGTLILWQLPPANQSLQHLDLAYLQQWTQANRYVRELTCDERTLYNVAPLCQATP